jgi:thimet oligopeptidase
MNLRFLQAAALAAASPLIALAASPKAPLVTMYADGAALTRDCDAGFDAVRQAVGQMAAKKGGEGIFAEWNRMFIRLEDATNVPELFAVIHPVKEVREAGEACEARFKKLQTEMKQDERLFARVKAARPANAHEAKLQRDLLRDFEDSGVALPPGKRAKAKELFEKIEAHRQAFERNVREDKTRVTFTPAELQGVPEGFLKTRKRDEAGNYVLGLDGPTYTSLMGNAKSEATRERYYRARFRQGGEANLEELRQVYVLRQELAALYGKPSFADYRLASRMAGKPDTVNKFLSDVKGAAGPVEKRELEVLREAKAAEIGKPLADTRLNWWDVSYYTERVRHARYDVDQEKLRAYFPADKSVEFVFRVVERLYGIKFKASEAPVWHPDVRYYEMYDAKSGAYLANAYLDLFPRDGKRQGAFAAPLRTASTAAGRTPSGALVANLDRRGFSQRELEVLLHEFGHVLNLLLSNVEYAPQAFTTVKWDFVEAPSQMFEEWARRPQTLALFGEVCRDCPQLTVEQIGRIEDARRFGMGMGYSRQQLLAAFDMELAQKPRAPLDVWRQIESASPLGHVEGTMFPAAFQHIVNEYGAGYYGYMWSRVIARDLLSQFGDNLLDPEVGARYRAAILGAGNEAEETEMVRRFLGREPNSEAFFAEITGKS